MIDVESAGCLFVKIKGVRMEYILYCDESVQVGPVYSGFFGGCIISAKDWQHVTNILNEKKNELNLYGEVKWAKVTSNYLKKYIDLMALFYSFVKDGTIKVRIIYQSNTEQPLEQNIKPDTRYFRQYYKFVKNAFGFKYLKSEKPIHLRIYLDSLPYNSNKRKELKKLLLDLPNTNKFKNSPIAIRNGDVAEVDSHEHVILQCMDIILGSMHFWLNYIDKNVSEEKDAPGNRTVAKEKLCEHIIGHINEIMPEFTVSETTSEYDDIVPECYWNHAYRHWRYVKEREIGSSDYTKEREALHANLTLDEIVEGSMEMDEKRKNK